MQNNKDLLKEIEDNSNTVFMSDVLNELLSEDTSTSLKFISCNIKTNKNLINFKLYSKETFDNFTVVSFSCRIESILLLEKEDITNISLSFENETIKTFDIEQYAFNLSWKQEDNNYLVDIFINKRGE